MAPGGVQRVGGQVAAWFRRVTGQASGRIQLTDTLPGGFSPSHDGAEPYSLKQRRRRFRCNPRSLLSSRFAMIILLIVTCMLAGLIYFWHSEGPYQIPWFPDKDSREFAQHPIPPAKEHTKIANYELPLRTKGRNIVDGRGRRFKLSSVNWYGASDELFVTGGLDVVHRSVIAESIKKLGFNSVRLPYADELVYKNPIVEERLLTANPDLIGLRALDILEAVTNALTDAGIAVIMNNHITTAVWCCGADPCDSGWANDHLGPICRVKQTEEQWIENWETVMKPHVNNPLVIGADLRNEVRGLWGTMPWSKWATAAEKCGNRLLKMNPDWLIFVEGTESANDLSGARTRPVVLDVENKLVYSAHIYAWSGWGSTEGRFLQRTYESFVRTMRHNWSYLLEQDTAPVWIGEIGAPRYPNLGDAHYWHNMMKYLKKVDADFGYWALNPRKPKGDIHEGYSILEDDWVTPIVDYRMKDMTELINQ
ncbi:unnamed protein product [Clonostachys rosea]|uniref:Glycoside hydrolase family 5 domain-containing protein n=1 Tax=Bionectria ochroleuca TaxID=29856 RepID=A0ABY6UT95_BIOOC|nr:unnamed protein product [Clonostachys rosea]